MTEWKHRRALPGAPAMGALEKDESEIRWLISYSDFMMQLVCLFILLYSVSSMEARKVGQLVQSWRQEMGIFPVAVERNPAGAKAVPLTREELPAVLWDLEVVLSQYPEGGHIRVMPTSDGFSLKMVYEMFGEGSGRFTALGERLVDLASQLLRPYQERVGSMEIVGHTAAGDAEREEGSALRLSLTRAREAYRRATLPDAPHRLSPEGLSAGGRGPHDPVTDNGAPDTRAFNRRVDFVVRLAESPKP